MLRDAMWPGDMGSQVHRGIEGGVDPGGWRQGSVIVTPCSGPVLAPPLPLCKRRTLRAMPLL